MLFLLSMFCLVKKALRYAKLYHSYKRDVPELLLADIFTKLIGQEPDQVIVPEERFWQAAKDYLYSR